MTELPVFYPYVFYVERAMGIEPTLSVWKTEVLPLNYARARLTILLAYCILSIFL